MARTLTPLDACAIMNSLVKQATGQASLTATNSSTFVSAGELVLATGVENTLNSLSLVLGRTWMAVRPYNAKLKIMNALDSEAYAHRMRKISFYSKDAVESGDWNTDQNTNLYNGYDNGTNSGASTASMWIQDKPVALEVNFGGQSVWQDVLTTYEYQLKQAFRSPEEFAKFVTGIMTEKSNDIESQKEAFNRMTLANYMAGLYDEDAVLSNGTAVNMTAAFNTKYGTSYTTANLLTTYLQEFLQFFVSEVKNYQQLLTERSKKFHWAPTKTVDGVSYTSLLRHTPINKQRMILYGPMFRDAEAQVYPQIFNPEYLKLGMKYETVNYWQSINSPASLSITPAIPDFAGTNSGAQGAGSAVALDHVIGVLYDEDALMVDYQLEDVATTPLEARKRYRNTWFTFSKNSINDFTENGILFYMADPDPTPDPGE